jgi:hypothetical protein
MQGFWPIFFLLVVLKIPVFAALWLVWWASKAPEPEASNTAGEDGDGFDRWRRQPIRPRGPRRGPPQAACEERLRSRRISRR